VFYVRLASGEKVRDPARLARLPALLREAIEALAEAERAQHR
jgi:hypothetical protein